MEKILKYLTIDNLVSVLSSVFALAFAGFVIFCVFYIINLGYQGTIKKVDNNKK